MTLVYCSAADLMGYTNHARLISQIASADYGQIPDADEVLNYIKDGISRPDNIEALQNIKARIDQAITNSASEINGLLALCGKLTIPAATLTTINMDLALARLFESLSDDSQIKHQADRWVAWFDKIATGKIAIATTPKPVLDTASSAMSAGTDVVWTEESLNGY